MTKSQGLSSGFAVISMTIGVMLLISIEFMPSVLLSPIASTLNVSEGSTGQAISASGIFAIITSLALTSVIGNIDRKWVLMGTSLALILSLVLTATAQKLSAIVFSRVLIGVSVGGFWSLAAATILRIVPRNQVAQAMTIMYMGQAIAATFSAPLGNMFAQMIGWRGVFWVVFPIAVLSLLLQLVSLPSMPSDKKQSPRTMLALFSRVYFRKAVMAVLLTWATGFLMFLYLRPFLEKITNADSNQISWAYLAIGLGGFVGTWISGRLVDQYLRSLLIIPPFVMGMVSVGLLILGENYWATISLLSIWGMMNTAISVIWLSYTSQNMEDEAEAAGGILVAVIQASIMLSGYIGGLLLDARGVQSSFIASIIVSVFAILMIGSGRKLIRDEK